MKPDLRMLLPLMLVTTAFAAPRMVLDEADYRDRVYACWLGKAIGGTLGLPVEGAREPHNFTFYTPVPTEQGANDDLDLQMLWLKALEENGPRIDARVLGEYWLGFVPVDWGEYGISKANQRLGFPPPLSGQVRNKWRDSNGAWIRSEIWACVAPGCPDLAARYAWEDACVDHGTAEGTYAEMFTASLESAAFVEHDRDKLLAVALSYIPPDCAVARSVKAAMKAKADGLDWAAARALVIKESETTGWFMAPQNVAFTVLGWLYGEEDFGKSICAAVNCGDDTDCTGATLGSLLGIIHGSKSIPDRWRAPVGEGIRTVAIAGFDNPKTVAELTDKTLAMAKRVLAEYEAPVAIGAKAEANGALNLVNEPAAKALWARSAYQLSAEMVALRATLDLRDEPVLSADTPWPVTVTLVNHTPHPQRVSLTWRLAEGLSGPAPATVELPASGRLEVPAELKAATVTARSVRGSLEVSSAGRTQIGVIPFAVGTRPAPRPGNLTPGAKVTVDSEYSHEPGCAKLLIDSEITSADDFEGHRWHAELKPHPHWAQIELAKSASIGRVVLHSADPKGHPVSFVGEVSADGQTWTKVFEETDWQDPLVYDKSFEPREGRFFRLTIRRSSSAEYPDAAQLSEIELLPPGK